MPAEAAELIEQGRRLLAFYQETGQDAAAATLASRLAIAKPEDEGFVSAHARLSLRTNARDEAIRAYLTLADLKAEKGETAGAVEIYRTLTSLDIANRHLYEGRLADLQRVVEVKVRRARRSRTTA